ncbi:hypothetical protein CW304_16995 [Bacillus sp. UFRGS-B20]|nr:hypothetical protein CW304_16995 [Bacillus sp. UFRGS-B20]
MQVSKGTHTGSQGSLDSWCAAYCKIAKNNQTIRRHITGREKWTRPEQLDEKEIGWLMREGGEYGKQKYTLGNNADRWA